MAWRFEDVNQIFDEIVWEFEIDPEEGGQPLITRSVVVHQHTGPWPGVAMQQGRTAPPRIPFSGRLLTQEQYEAFERWFMYRILLDMVDDLGRRFRGVLIRWDPTRVYKPYDPWYHEYQAEFVVWAGQNANGDMIYGWMEDSGIDDPPEPEPEDIVDDPPDAPTGLQGDFVSTTEIDLSWRLVTGAVSYNVERNSVTIATGVIGSHYTDTGSSITTNTYRVQAVDANGSVSAWSEAFAIEPSLNSNLARTDGLDVQLAESGAVDVVLTVQTAVGIDELDIDLSESSLVTTVEDLTVGLDELDVSLTESSAVAVL